MQRRCSAECGHILPPCMADPAWERTRDCVPVPHDLVHADQPVKAVMVQSTGHGASLQAFDSRRWPHEAPPLSGGVEMSRSRMWEPLPHVFVQAPHELHAERTQSTGHACVLQSPFSTR